MGEGKRGRGGGWGEGVRREGLEFHNKRAEIRGRAFTAANGIK